MGGEEPMGKEEAAGGEKSMVGEEPVGGEEELVGWKGWNSRWCRKGWGFGWGGG